MRLCQTRSLWSWSRATMALYQPPDPNKLIFAPAGTQEHGQAEQFTKGRLHRRDLDPRSPTAQFHAWFEEARRCPGGAVPHPEACALSTAELPSGRVSSRMVYLKELDVGGGFVVYSNFGTSRKARDLETNGHASLLFFWEAMQRQVRVEGTAARMSREESQRYFDTRVRGSRLGAWASRQSEVLQPRTGAKGEEGEDDGRAQLEEQVREVEERFAGTEHIPVPEFWGGLRIVPDRVEFWQGRESRLHDRFVYERRGGQGGDESATAGSLATTSADGEWTLERLNP